MIFQPRGLDLLLLALGEDVVPQHVLLAVVLVEAAGLGAVDEVVLEEDARAAFIGIHAPAAVGIGIDVVEDVVADHGAFGGAERIDAAHVAQQAPAQVMDVVEGERVPFGQALVVAPRPAGGNAGVEEVGDFVVRDRVVAALPDPHAHGTGENPPAVAQDVVVDFDVPGPLRFVADDPRLADPHGPGPEIVDIAMPQGAIAAGVPEPDRVDADVADLAVLDRHVPGGVGHDRRLDLRGGLHGLETAPRREPLAMAEGQPANGDVLDELARRGIAFETRNFSATGATTSALAMSSPGSGM